MIRDATVDDLAALEALMRDTNMFSEDERAAFGKELQTLLWAAPDPAERRRLIIVGATADGAIGGAAYFGPEAMADDVANLFFIGVSPSRRRQGAAKALIDRFETHGRETGARIALIETASAAMFEPARRLYRRCGYTEEAQIRDYYADGLDKLIYRKRLRAAMLAFSFARLQRGAPASSPRSSDR
ncbi:MAG: N-acetyltransferase [Pseudomonadota bacterium]